MNADQLMRCSSTDLRCTQERIEKILKGKKMNSSPRRARTACAATDNPPRTGCVSESNNVTVCGQHLHDHAGLRRSRSLIDLKEDVSANSFPPLPRTYHKIRTTALGNKYRYFGEINSDSISEDSDEVEDEASNTHSNKIENSKHYRKLSNAVQRLSSILIDVQTSTFTCYQCCSSKCVHLRNLRKKGVVSIPSLDDKHFMPKFAEIIDALSEKLEREIVCFISFSTEEKTRLEKVQSSNATLKQRLTNSLRVQRNLEEDLAELSKRNNQLLIENHNLSIKSNPLNPESIQSGPTEGGTGRSRQVRRDGSYQRRTDSRNNNNGTENVEQFPDQNAETTHIEVITNSTVISMPNEEQNQNQADFEEPSFGNHPDNEACHQELDSISSYVRWKTMDFGRLHEKLNRSFEEMDKLRGDMSRMTQEREEMLSDVEDLVEVCKELERERDNYESILKMILKEKDCPQSNLHELLDGFLHKLNNSSNLCSRSNSSHRGADQYNRFSSRCFLESALHVIQEQNISLREEMTKLKESVQKTAGQNMLLQSNNDTLTEKVQEVQRQMETKEHETEEKENDSREKYEKLDQLYKLVLAAKDDLENRLLEKEKEIAVLQNLGETSESTSARQAEKIQELQKANVKLEKEISKFKNNIDKSNQVLCQLKSNLKDEKGKWGERVRITSNELQSTKEHCKWLQTQVDNLNSQLVDAHERIKLHEKDKSVLAQRVLSADEERKTLDRKILEIKSIMHGDTVYREALAERNELLQSEINRLRKQSIVNEATRNSPEPISISLLGSTSCGNAEKRDHKSTGDQPSTLDELSSITSVVPKHTGHHRDVTPLSRKSRLQHHHSNNRKHLMDTAPRAAVRGQLPFTK